MEYIKGGHPGIVANVLFLALRACYMDVPNYSLFICMLYFKILKNSKKGVFSEDSFCTGLIIS